MQPPAPGLLRPRLSGGGPPGSRSFRKRCGHDDAPYARPKECPHSSCRCTAVPMKRRYMLPARCTRYSGLRKGYVYVSYVRLFTLRIQIPFGNEAVPWKRHPRFWGYSRPVTGHVTWRGREKRSNLHNFRHDRGRFSGIIWKMQAKKMAGENRPCKHWSRHGPAPEGNTRERQWEEECALEMMPICCFTR